jgi:hypothetical protein
MKPSFRRHRRRSKPSKNEGAFFKKESKGEQGFFGEATHDTFFQPAVTATSSPAVQRKCDACEHEEKNVQRATDKKEEDKKLQRATDKKEEDDKKLMRAEEKKDEDKKLQRAPEKKEEDDKKLMRAEEKKEEDKKLQRAPEKKEEDDKKVQKKEAGGASVPASGVSSYIGALHGKGQSMAPLTNRFFSSRMGYDFSHVKIHTDKDAAESAKSVNAKAYTIGNNIVFNEGHYNTESIEGKKLLAHELTHVMQNGTESQTIQRQAPAHTPGHAPALPPVVRCVDEVDITTEFRTFITTAQQRISSITTLSDERKTQINDVIQSIASAEGGVNISNFTVLSCSRINNPLAMPGESVGAEVDATARILRLSTSTWDQAAEFLSSNSIAELTAFFQTIAHEKRHATLGSTVQVAPTDLQPGFTQADADQAAYRTEEILVNAEEIAIGKRMRGDRYSVPVSLQQQIRRHWSMVEARVTDAERTRLRNLIITQLRNRYVAGGGCDHAITLGVVSCMEHGQWYRCSSGSVTGTIPEGLNLCSNEDGTHRVCGIH